MKKMISLNQSEIQKIIVDYVKKKFDTEEILSVKTSSAGRVFEIEFNYHKADLGFQVYFGEFKDQEDLEEGYMTLIPANQEVVYADYDCYEDDYSGNSTVLLYDYTKKKYLIVESSHCSCNGLQWDNPDETNLEAIKMMKNNELYSNALKFEVYLLNQKQDHLIGSSQMS